MLNIVKNVIFCAVPFTFCILFVVHHASFLNKTLKDPYFFNETFYRTSTEKVNPYTSVISLLTPKQKLSHNLRTNEKANFVDSGKLDFGVLHDKYSPKRFIRSPIATEKAEYNKSVENINEGESTTIRNALESQNVNLESTTLSHNRSSKAEFQSNNDEKSKSGRNNYDYDQDYYSNPYLGTFVNVDVFLIIGAISNIDERDETLTLDIDLQMTWKRAGIKLDLSKLIVSSHVDRFRNTLHIVDLKDVKDVWIPEINFEENIILTKQSFIKKPLNFTYNDLFKQFTYLTRDSVKVKCKMDFQYYPVDTQRCNFTVKSYSYTVRNHANWDQRDGKTGVYFEDPFDSNFGLQVVSIKDTNTKKYVEGTGCTWPYLNVEPSFVVLVRRSISYHMAQTYLPSILLILINCLCFLVPLEMIEVGVEISLTTFLTLTAMFSSVRESTPTVSYVKAIDIWMAMCIFFVFLTLLEFTTLLWLRPMRPAAEKNRLEDQTELEAFDSLSKGIRRVGLFVLFNRMRTERQVAEKMREKNQIKLLQALDGVIQRKCSNAVAPSELNGNFTFDEKKLQKYEYFLVNLEKYGFIVFFSCFIIFNIIYWSWLLIASGYGTWSMNEKHNNVNRGFLWRLPNHENRFDENGC